MDILALIISALSLVGAGVGTYLARQVMETGKPGDSVEQRVKNLDLLMSWAHALSGNLRHLRSTGHDVVALAKLQKNAEEGVVALHARHGWKLPPSGNVRIQLLE